MSDTRHMSYASLRFGNRCTAEVDPLTADGAARHGGCCPRADTRAILVVTGAVPSAAARILPVLARPLAERVPVARPSKW